jgi:CrcB protein
MKAQIQVKVVLAVAVGGAAGAVARYWIGEAAPTATGSFPWATFTINVTGSFLLALLPAFAIVVDHPLMPPALGTGVLGGYTTLSSYAEETRHLAASGHGGVAATYLTATFAACLVAVALADRFSTQALRSRFADEEGDL